MTRTLLPYFGTTETTERHRVAAERLADQTDRAREVAAAVGTGSSVLKLSRPCSEAKRP
ncbi:hypothetical protein V3N99_07505 [Dermatophilaceae bacterium Soc4.6]